VGLRIEKLVQPVKKFSRFEIRRTSVRQSGSKLTPHKSDLTQMLFTHKKLLFFLELESLKDQFQQP
jgi:hypothetical protein